MSQEEVDLANQELFYLSFNWLCIPDASLMDSTGISSVVGIIKFSFDPDRCITVEYYQKKHRGHHIACISDCMTNTYPYPSKGPVHVS